VEKTAEFTFKKADLDESGFIENNKVEGLIAALIESTDLPGFLSPPTEAQASCYLQAADANRDGKVSLTEWKVFVKDFITSRLVSLLALVRLTPGRTFSMFVGGFPSTLRRPLGSRRLPTW
jgi:hypothetical protein